MSKRFLIPFLALVVVVAASGTAAIAGAKIKINDDSEIDFGFRLQTLFNSTKADIDSTDGETRLETDNNFLIRRARLRVGATIGTKFAIFLQTEFNEEASVNALGGDVRLIDAFVTYKPTKYFNVIVGENMAPATRQNMTSSGALLAIDRPSMANKTLTWGLRGKHDFTISTTPQSGASLPGDETRTGIFGKVGVRDLGVTLFGNPDVGDAAHLKYYVGVYDGINAQGSDTMRMTGRVQLNLWDAESGYYNLATYLGKKKTLAFGLSYDTQSEVARVAQEVGFTTFDYKLTEVDVFLDYPIGDNAITAEAAWEKMDLDGFAPSAEGDGFYIQAGYLVKKLQPWVKYETWSSDATSVGGNTAGDYNLTSLGLSYFFHGHNANLKLGYEMFKADYALDVTGEDKVNSFVIGFFTTY